MADHDVRGRIVGHCLCRSVTIEVDGAHVAAVGACHCRMCQAWSGALFAAFDADAAAVTVTGEVARYQSSNFAERAFCPRCGSHLWLRDTDPEGEPYELMPGLFVDAAAFPLASEIYIDRRPAYLPPAGEYRTQTRADYERDHRSIEGDTP
ncbi:GFA family protein [Jannaschia pohangensis]|uniref:Uncharacterized conserved protein n=1 Tax=Jannaschia pohangensis TaxID=390807 RepID=A0A1I3TAR2_9RHOB|nr:GFA family protein [Jannaschia pohangensis]SFJ68278.1 Uncharacterized conserved protein [Jannaschia pohangensis]